MKMTMIVKRAGFAILVVLGSAYYAAVQAQPATTTTAATAEQEFIEAIKKGNSARVGELLKQQPSLIKATYKNGITMVMLAVYAHHPEIAESFIATGIEPNIFESAATGRVNRVREIIKKNPELVHASSPDGWTARHLTFNHPEGARLLLHACAGLHLN